MKQREPEGSTKESPESFIGLSDLLSQATDSYPQGRKNILTCVEYLFSLMVCIALCLFKHNLRTLDIVPGGIQPAYCIIDKVLKIEKCVLVLLLAKSFELYAFDRSFCHFLGVKCIISG